MRIFMIPAGLLVAGLAESSSAALIVLEQQHSGSVSPCYSLDCASSGTGPLFVGSSEIGFIPDGTASGGARAGIYQSDPGKWIIQAAASASVFCYTSIPGIYCNLSGKTAFASFGYDVHFRTDQSFLMQITSMQDDGTGSYRLTGPALNESRTFGSDPTFVSGLPPGDYFVHIQADTSAVFTPGGNFYSRTEATFAITLVPEPSLMGVEALGLLCVGWRRSVRRGPMKTLASGSWL